MLLGVPGCRWWRTENPRVGSSILSLATISIRNLRWQPSRSERRCFHFVSTLTGLTREARRLPCTRRSSSVSVQPCLSCQASVHPRRPVAHEGRADQFRGRHAHDGCEILDHVRLIRESGCIGDVRPGCSSSPRRKYSFDANNARESLRTHPKHRAEVPPQIPFTNVKSSGELPHAQTRISLQQGGSPGHSRLGFARAQIRQQKCPHVGESLSAGTRLGKLLPQQPGACRRGHQARPWRRGNSSGARPQGAWPPRA